MSIFILSKLDARNLLLWLHANPAINVALYFDAEKKDIHTHTHTFRNNMYVFIFLFFRSLSAPFLAVWLLFFDEKLQNVSLLNISIHFVKMVAGLDFSGEFKVKRHSISTHFPCEMLREHCNRCQFYLKIDVDIVKIQSNLRPIKNQIVS